MSSIDIENLRGDILKKLKGPCVFIKAKPGIWNGDFTLDWESLYLDTESLTEEEKKLLKTSVKKGKEKVFPNSIRKEFMEIYNKFVALLKESRDEVKHPYLGGIGWMIPLSDYNDWRTTDYETYLKEYEERADKLCFSDEYKDFLANAKKIIKEVAYIKFKIKTYKTIEGDEDGTNKISKDEKDLIEGIAKNLISKIPNQEDLRKKFWLRYSWKKLGHYEKPFNKEEYKDQKQKEAIDLLQQDYINNIKEGYEEAVDKTLKILAKGAGKIVDEINNELSMEGGTFNESHKRKLSNAISSIKGFNIFNNKELSKQVDELEDALGSFAYKGYEDNIDGSLSIKDALSNFNDTLKAIKQEVMESEATQAAANIEL
jgi:hypothetical protein